MKLFKGLNIEIVLDESIPEGEVYLMNRNEMLGRGPIMSQEYPQEEYDYINGVFTPNPFHPKWRKK